MNYQAIELRAGRWAVRVEGKPNSVRYVKAASAAEAIALVQGPQPATLADTIFNIGAL